MTTIAATTQGIAADSLFETRAFSFNSKTSKLWVHNESIFGFSGDLGDSFLFRKWITEGGDKPELDQSFAAIELSEGKLYLWCNDLVKLPLGTDFYSIGSGSPHAIVALDMGMPPEKAVAVACKFDPTSALPIDVIYAANLAGLSERMARLEQVN